MIYSKNNEMNINNEFIRYMCFNRKLPLCDFRASAPIIAALRIKASVGGLAVTE